MNSRACPAAARSATLRSTIATVFIFETEDDELCRKLYETVKN